MAYGEYGHSDDCGNTDDCFQGFEDGLGWAGAKVVDASVHTWRNVTHVGKSLSGPRKIYWNSRPLGKELVMSLRSHRRTITTGLHKGTLATAGIVSDRCKQKYNWYDDMHSSSTSWLTVTQIAWCAKRLNDQYQDCLLAENPFTFEDKYRSPSIDELQPIMPNEALLDPGKRLVMLPININKCHWTLLAIDKQKKELRFLDSLGRNYTYSRRDLLASLHNIERYVFRITQENYMFCHPVGKKGVKHPSSIEHCQQFDSFSCGTFVLYYAGILAAKPSLSEALTYINSREYSEVQPAIHKVRKQARIEIKDEVRMKKKAGWLKV